MMNKSNKTDRSMGANSKANYMKAKEYDENVFEIKRVSKKNSGGSSVSFTALVIIGNKNGKVGVGLGKAKDVSRAIQKGLTKAKGALVDINLKGDTIPHEVYHKYAASNVLLKPAPKGSGIIAGSSLRVVLELAGVKDVSAKMLGSNNKLANVRCTIGALSKLKKKVA